MALLCGIDYGSKLAGTTVAAFLWTETGAMQWFYSAKKQDADAMLQACLTDLRPELVMLDAPMSLPRVYQDPQILQPDYFYRAGDKMLRAMSPMFLGGLTARAMQMAAFCKKLSIPIFETYPARQADRLSLNRTLYNKSQAHISAIQTQITTHYTIFRQCPPLPSWHAVDALLALVGALRYAENTHTCYGDPTEGVIYI